ncbi:type IV pilus twitching motility protein PilT [Selenomonas sp. TAMA-11512]|uniref:type IV pilus twitching motility protein PilT n=1 Tax=Selenomonas sp. TAMA-11512 TaxID=3095337 RepID=UPI00308A18F1|nr:type IV pilus twitching motility protein PilT [Selenomonas sp. TAMA-11512]
MADECTLDLLLREAIEKNASDVHIVCGQIPKLRIHGRLYSLGSCAVSAEAVRIFLKAVLSDVQRLHLEQERQLDFAFTEAERRFRGVAYYALGETALSLRLLPRDIPTPDALGMPSALRSLTGEKHGLILIGGKTGSGKSTTLAAFLEEINQTRDAHVLTLEDPIEVIFTPKRAVISQRELGRDFTSFPEGLKAALRSDPDILMIGELREAQTMRIALQAAETGTLVLATLHTKNAVEAAIRIEGMFPSEEQEQIRQQLAAALLGVFSQRLLPMKGEGRIAATEVLLTTPAVKNILRTGKFAQLANVILSGRSQGMQSMHDAIRLLEKQGKIASSTM